MAEQEKLFDVIEVEFSAPNRVRIMGSNKTKKNADAVLSMAIARRGIKRHFFSIEPAGRYKDGDSWKDRQSASN